jgi:protein gp37
MHERFHGKGSFDTITLHPERLDQPLRWRKPSRVFVNSMSDLFHRDVPDEHVVKVFDVMANARRHTFQVLTKRHARMRSFVTKYVAGGFGDPAFGGVGVLSNVWLGVSVENQQWADIRIRALRGTPAAVRFLSCEPLLGPLDGLDLTGISWVIVGGESGHGARPMSVDWVRSLRDQCVAADVPFLFKQWGAYDDRGRHLSKKLAGRQLDGRFWDQYPAGAA